MKVLDEQPADWDVTKVARIWETLLTKYPKIDAAFFHNDDMALAAYNVMKAKGRTEIKIGGVDAMPPAIKAVHDGHDVRDRAQSVLPHPWRRDHRRRRGGRQRREDRHRTFRRTSSPTARSSPRPTRAGMLWMENQFLI